MPEVRLNLAALHLSAELRLSLPSALAQQRSNIRIVEEQLHTASAEVGVAVVDMNPWFSITAGEVSSALRIVDLFTSGTRFWNLARSVPRPLFQGGTLFQRKRAADGAYEQALYQCRGAVLSAL